MTTICQVGQLRMGAIGNWIEVTQSSVTLEGVLLSVKIFDKRRGVVTLGIEGVDGTETSVNVKLDYTVSITHHTSLKVSP